MLRPGSIAAACCLLATSLSAQLPGQPPIVGKWDLTLTAPDGRSLPSWLEVHQSGTHTLVGQMVGVVGSVRPISQVLFASDTMRFALPPQWESGDSDFQFSGVFANGTLSGTVVTPDGAHFTWTAVRAPALARKGPPVWGRPIKLFNGTDLTGWHAVGGTNQWKAISGVLTNTQRGGNLVTDQTFTDFTLHAEYRYPAEGNSGIYLRGRYEAQIEDSTGRELSTGGLGAIYGFLIPNENAAKGANEWQTYDITLVGRLVTVVLNGKTVVCRQKIPGITGGALDSREGEPGPIMLQGDHGPVEYRNVILTPAR